MRSGLPGVALVFALGCASPGVPKPPSLQLPERATAVDVRRTGDRVELRWRGSADTTDGALVKGEVTAAICESLPAGGACRRVLEVPSTPGENHAEVTLSAAESAGPPRLAEYRIELRNARGRSAGRTAPAYTVAGAAPRVPANFKAAARRAGVELTWQPVAQAVGGPVAGGDVIEVERTSRRTGNASRTHGPEVGSPRHPPPALETLRLAGPPAGLPDPGGMLDRGVKEGEQYGYVAQRVQSAVLDGHMLQWRSEPSAAASVTYRNLFPPAAPSGLVTIPGGGYGKPLVIDLSWEPGTERNVAGYRVYRSTDGGEPRLLTASPITGTSFRDTEVAASHRYQYSVSALDGNGNESERSAAADERLR